MINTLHIQKYRSIDSDTLKLAPFTVFVGDNDQGKTTIIRAITALFFNDVSPDDLHFDAARCSIQADFDDGLRVKLVRGSKNAYLLKKRNGIQQEFPKVGRAVPSEVEEALQVFCVSLGGVDFRLQVQSQFEGPLIKAYSSGILSQVFDQLIGVEKLTAASGYARKDLLEAQSDLRRDEGLFKDTTAEAALWEEWTQKLAPLKSLYEEYSDLLGLLSYVEARDKFRNLSAKENWLATEVDKILGYKEKIQAGLLGIRLKRDLVKVKALLGKCEELASTWESLFLAYSDIRVQVVALLQHRQMEKTTILVEKLQSLVLPDTDEMLTNITKISKLAEILQAERNVDELDKEWENKNLSLDHSLKERKKLTLQLKVCPVCGQELKGKAREKCLEYLL